jgi:hypothetical protein
VILQGIFHSQQKISGSQIQAPYRMSRNGLDLNNHGATTQTSDIAKSLFSVRESILYLGKFEI